jgi:hypothetical protein
MSAVGPSVAMAVRPIAASVATARNARNAGAIKPVEERFDGLEVVVVGVIFIFPERNSLGREDRHSRGGCQMPPREIYI